MILDAIRKEDEGIRVDENGDRESEEDEEWNKCGERGERREAGVDAIFMCRSERRTVASEEENFIDPKSCGKREHAERKEKGRHVGEEDRCDERRHYGSNAHLKTKDRTEH